MSALKGRFDSLGGVCTQSLSEARRLYNSHFKICTCAKDGTARHKNGRTTLTDCPRLANSAAVEDYLVYKRARFSVEDAKSRTTSNKLPRKACQIMHYTGRCNQLTMCVQVIR